MGKSFLWDAGPSLEHTDVPHAPGLSAAIQESTRLCSRHRREPGVLIFSLAVRKYCDRHHTGSFASHTKNVGPLFPALALSSGPLLVFRGAMGSLGQGVSRGPVLWWSSEVTHVELPIAVLQDVMAWLSHRTASLRKTFSFIFFHIAAFSIPTDGCYCPLPETFFFSSIK